MITVDVKLTPAQLAQGFCDLDDQGQADFFIAAAQIAKEQFVGRGSGGPSWQWHSIGRHLWKCECSTYEAREMVRQIADAIDETEKT